MAMLPTISSSPAVSGSSTAPVGLPGTKSAPAASAPGVAAQPMGARTSVSLALLAGLTASKTAQFAPGGDVNGDGNFDPGDKIMYTVTITNMTGGTLTNVQFTDTVDTNTNLDAASIKTSPIAFPDSYNAVGNVSINVSNTAQGLLANDIDPDTGNNTGLTASGPTTTTGGGTLSINANGTFTYSPAPGFSGADTFTYTVTDTTGKTDTTGAVTITVSTPIWFINNTAGACPSGCNGTFDKPYPSMAAYNANTLDEPGDFIFLYQGTGNYTEGITLLNNQQLIGQGVDLKTVYEAATSTTVPAYSSALPGATSNPTITTSSGSGITLAQGNTIRGLTVGNTAVSDITGSGFGTLTVSTVTLNGTGQALNLTNGNFAASSAFTSVTTTSSTTQGIFLQQIGGTVALGSTTVSGSTAEGIVVQQSTADINFGNTSVTGGTTGVLLNNNSAGTRTFGTLAISTGSSFGFRHQAAGGIVNVTGATTITNPTGIGISINASTTAITFAATTVNKGSSAGTGVDIQSSSGATTFNVLNITTSNGTGLNISSNTGAVNATTNTGDISATNGPAISVSTGLLGLNFDQVTSINSTTDGIFLNVASGSLSIATTTTTNAADESIQVTSSSATLNFGNVTDTGAAGSGGTPASVVLTSNTGAITFADLDITPDTGVAGLQATENSGLITTTSGTISTVNGTSVEITKTTGTTPLAMVLTSVSLNAASGTTGNNGIKLVNTTNNGGSTTSFSVAGGTIKNTIATLGVADTSTNAIGIYMSNAKNVVFSGMTVRDHKNFAIRGVNVNGFTMTNCTITSNIAGGQFNGDSDTLDEASVSFSGLIGTCSITGGEISGGFENNLDIDNNNNGTLNLTVSGVMIKDVSPAVGSDGIFIEGDTGDNITVNITGNTFTRNRGDHFQFSAQTGLVANVTFTCNTITGGSASPVTQGIGIDAAIFTGTLTYSVKNNTIRDTTAGGAIRIVKSSGTGTFQGTVEGNKIGDPAVAESGASTSSGIRIENFGEGTHTALVNNNKVYQYDQTGIEMTVGQASNGILNVTVTNNTLANPGPNASHGVHLNAGPQPAATGIIARVDIRSNTLNGSGVPANSGFEIRIRERNTNVTVHQDGLGGGAGGTEAAAEAQLIANNSVTPGGVDVTSADGTIGGQATPDPPAAAAAPCAVPTSLNPIEAVQAAGAGVDDVSAAGDNAGNDGGDQKAQAVTPSYVDYMYAPDITFDGNHNLVALSQRELNAIADAVLDRWKALGLSGNDLAQLKSLKVDVADLPGDLLIVTTLDKIIVDETAGGLGWFIDQTPGDDSEFGAEDRAGSLSSAYKRIDLLSALTRGFTYVLEHEFVNRTKNVKVLMDSTIPLSVRRMPVALPNRPGKPDAKPQSHDDDTKVGIVKQQEPSAAEVVNKQKDEAAVVATGAEKETEAFGIPENGKVNSLYNFIDRYPELRVTRVGTGLRRNALKPSYAVLVKPASAPLAPQFGGTVTRTIGNLPNGKVVTIMFEATINSSLPAGVCSVSNTGQVTATGQSPVNTNTVVTTVQVPPTITAAAAITRVQGNAAANSQIATVDDCNQAENTLIVTSNSPVNGVTISNISVAANGVVTADVAASCTATNATFTLTVTDNTAPTPKTATAMFTVNVTPNTPPTLGNYPNSMVSPGGSTTVTPDAAPTDNGTISTLTASAPGFAGTFSGNTTTGVITVTNANPPGIYTVTVTATDNCSATTTKTFTLSVNNPPTITGQTISRQQGSPASNSLIATVNDADQTEDTLMVTATPLTGMGVTVSNIVVAANGNVTADVVASCTATNSTFTLTVTDAVGVMATSTLTVNVTPNTPPVLTYAALQSVSSGGSTTINPATGPTDNGTITSIVVQSQGGYTGTISVDNMTGVISVSNAAPPGNHTINIVATDNCGATTSAMFTLQVVAPPMLGNYPNATLALSGNTTISPDAAPSAVTEITVSTSTSFDGILTADPTTGVVRVTDALPAKIPAGAYTVTVTGFNVAGDSTSKTFTLTVTTTPVCEPPAFASASDVPVGTQPGSIAIGDFDGDGDQDIAVANLGSSTVSIRLGDGLGGFTGATNVGVGASPRSVAVGDFNGDGKQDLAVATQSGPVSIRLGDGLGGFTNAADVTAGTNPYSVAVGDFDGDNRQDIAVANFGSGTVSIRLGNGMGGFTGSTNVTVGSQPVSVAIGDFNNDGKQDFAVTNQNSFTVSVRLGDGMGGFTNAADISIAFGNPVAVAVGDFDGNGNQDLAIAAFNSSLVAIRLGDGLGGFSGSTNVSVAANPQSVAIGDFNGDGNQDIAASNYLSTNVVSIRLGNGTGGFTGTTDVGVGAGPRSVAVGDFNEDGRQDLATANETDGDVSIRLRQCPPTIVAIAASQQQGSPASNNVPIATVMDAEDAENTLTVTVDNGASSTVNGVTVSNIAVDASGNVTATIVATCTATNAAFTLKVTDSAGGSATTTLNVTATANTPPTLGTYPTSAVALNGSGMVTPSAAPTDNGSVVTLTASAPGFAGTFSGNTTTGVITVTNASPGGSYTVTVTATDNCGATTTTTFTLNVNNAPTITGATISRQQGSPSSNSQIATVNDIEDGPNSLVVTVNGGASATVNGVTVSNIVNNAGNVTADVVASCTATNATFTLTVTDSTGQTNTATLTVNVTPNTPPTLGTYPNSSATTNGGTTVTPNAAPTDNGSVVTLTASAPGFAGTFSGNTTTGVITVTNAGPAGNYTVTVTATDNCGATTTTTFTLAVNTAPTITGATISRQQGSAASNSQIATVSDVDQAANTLVVTVNGGATATVNGVTVNNIVVAANGSVTADVVASCTATNASFTLTVTDSNGGSATATLTVNVTPNTPPTLGTYPTTTVNPGGSTTVTPNAAPTDNGSIATLTASAPGFGGTFSGNTTTGVITVNNGNPPGTYTVTVTATDNCGATTTTTFTLVVNTPPQITGATISRQQGSAASNSQIATVSDANQAANTLTVTVNGGASATVNGVTVSGISIDGAGNVTASVVANCTATNATFTLTVTDNGGLSSNATLTVNVTPNTPPTLGTYPNTTVNPGASTTVTPNAAPTDNGSIATLTASAPGFAGTFSGNTTTGVITVTNANPIGTYTVTVTATDNCGAQTTTTFTLVVNNPPTITGATISRQQGSPASNSQIATVSDADQAANTLTVTVNGGASATVNGVTVGSISIDAAGNVTATVVANCTATNASFTLTVTDSVGATATATLTVNVTPNTPPTLGNYPNAGPINVGTGTTVTPNAAPTDNGSVAMLTASAPGFAGTFSGNTTTGVITISNAMPAGTYTVTVTATDNCGATSTKTFTLFVNNPPQITALPVSQPQGVPGMVKQIAIVSDANQPANTLVVTINGGASATVNGVTVSGISIDAAGNVTATVVATCTATNASFTLVVTDNLGATAMATLNVTVTADPVFPTITCPGNITAKTNLPNQTVAVVNYTVPSVGAGTVGDNCGIQNVVCSPAPGSLFATGTTTVTCTATDNSNNTAQCTFKVTVYDVVLQDDSNPNRVMAFNSFTGDYVFCCPGSAPVSGKGTVTKQGSEITLQHNPADRRVTAKVSTSTKTGSASLQMPPGTTKCTITDSNILNSVAACPAP